MMHKVYPNNFSRSSNIERTDDSYQSTSNDPFFEFQWPSELRPGWYEVVIDLDAPKLTLPKLYFDFGHGYSEAFSIPLSILQKKVETLAISTPMRISHSPINVRFDPMEVKGNFSFSYIGLRRLRPLQVFSLLFSKAVNLVKGGPIKNTARIVTACKSLLRKQNLQAFQPLNKVEIVSSSAAGIYQNWRDENDYNSPQDLVRIEKSVLEFSHHPLISILVPTYDTPLDLLDKMIQSCLDQVYPNWELCIADDKSPDNDIKERLNYWAQKDDRIKVTFRSENGHISEATNTAAKSATGSWFLLLDHDDIISPHALAMIVNVINQKPDVEMIYSDEDKIDMAGYRKEPYHKSGWNYQLFLSQNMFSHIGVYKSELFKKVKGFRKGFEGAQDYDLALRCISEIQRDKIHHIPHVLYHWRQLPGSTSLEASEKPYAMIAGQTALQSHIDSQGLNGEVKLIGHGYVINWPTPAPAPKVSIIIPTKNRDDLLRTCIDSILNISTYKNYDIIIVDNQSDDPATLSYLKELEKKGITILQYDYAFNFSQICNFAVAKTDADYVVLLNNDTKVLTPRWLEQLLGLAMQQQIGAVGAKLWYPNDTLQHSGLILSPVHIAMNQGKGTPKGTHGYFGRTSLTHECSAVSAACLMVSKNKYIEVGGLNHTDLAVAYNDVDFCLKLMSKGYHNVCQNTVELYHYESATRNLDKLENVRFTRERNYMFKTWGHLLKNDPYYNPNLTNFDDNFALAEEPRQTFYWRD